MTTATAVYATQLTRAEQIAEGTMAFHFAKPADFQFRAGQYLDLTLIDPPESDAEGNIRGFSIASPPFGDDLMIATRMRDSAFKRVLARDGTHVNIKMEGPGGSFVLHKNVEKPAVFLAGGIGITPFFSIIQQATHEKTPQQLYLFYSNRRPEDAPFLEALQEMAEHNPNFHFIATMTKMERSDRAWRGEKGVLNEEMLLRYVPSLQGPIFYVAGPPAMVAAMRRMLTGAGVDEDDIRTEEFSGY
jgi:ferredoxin-NADP reductase